MNKQHFTYKEIFRFSWAKTKQHAWFMVCTLLIGLIIGSAVRGTGLLETVVFMLIALSLASISLTIVRDHSFTFADLYKPLLSHRLVLKFTALTSLFLVVIMLLMIPLIGFLATFTRVPYIVSFIYLCFSPLVFVAIYLSVRFKFFPFVVLENEHMDLKQIIKLSLKITHGSFWKIFGALMIMCGLNIVGAMLFGVGLLVSVPITLFATAHLYRKLVETM